MPGDRTNEYLLENICRDVKAGLAYADIAVLCPNRCQTEKYYHLLRRRKVPAYWLVRDAEAKRNYDAAADSVLISTVHSPS